MFEVTQRWMRSWDLLDVDGRSAVGFERAVLA
jgi:hypothetical protein